MSARSSGLRALLLSAALTLVACGGGTTSTSTFTPNTGGGGGGGGTANAAVGVCTATNEQNSVARSAANASTVYMDYCAVSGTSGGTPTASATNLPYVSVYLCAPGSTTNCAWIDHLQVDTGSVGLRVLAGAVPSSLLAALPVVHPAVSPTANAAECYQFVLSYFWGGLRTADLKLGGTIAPNANAGSNSAVAITNAKVQIINDPLLPPDAPATAGCVTGGGTKESSAVGIGANGILGVGLFSDDCNGNCASGAYFFCTSTSATSCSTYVPVTGTGVPVANSEAVQNPVALATSSLYNSGVIFELDPAATIRNNATSYTYTGNVTSYSSVAGRLVYGAASPPNRLVADQFTGRISISVNGTLVAASTGSTQGGFIDSGSNALFFNVTAKGGDFNLPLADCASNASFACINAGSPSPYPLTLAFGNVNAASAGTALPSPALSIYDATFLFTTVGVQNGPAYEGLAGIQTSSQFAHQFDFGMPFLFGRTVYFGIQSPNDPTTPFYGL
jgi:hypothetical protein